MEMTPHKEKEKSRWLPYLIAIVGIVISIISWFFSIRKEIATHYLDSLTASFPWIVLFAGILISLMIGLMIRLTYLTHERKQSLDKINRDFQNEMAERIHAEETKQKLESAMLQGQKLQAIGTLAGGIAHDFNNILYAIIGYVEMAQDDIPKESITHENLGKVILAARRGQELIARILAFSRRQHHELKPICLKDTIEGVLALLKPTIPASVTINVIFDLSDNPYILGNQTLLHQIIVNMINNAVDAMDSEGTVILKLSRVLPNDEILEQLPQAQPTQYCRIDLSDTGHGMDQTTIARIFEPFFTTKEVGKGTGLGLSTVHAIVKEHEGEIIVKSQLGHGTTFTILLPEYLEGVTTNQ